MPLLKVQISLPEISKSSSCKVRTKGTEILSSAIGKSPEFVMVIVESGLCASFGGNQTEPCAYLEVKNVGVNYGQIESHPRGVDGKRVRD